MQASPSISKVLVVGPKGSGKTSLLCRLIYDSVNECDQLPGQFLKFNFSRGNGDSVSFLFKEVNNLPTSEKKSAYILTLNSNNKADLESLPNTLSMISDKRVIIALCMSDLHYSAAFWVEDVKKAVGKKDIKVVPVSSKTGENIKQFMLDLSDMVFS
ncbi:MAG: GTPase domain-containing protein [Candidatus Thermoplasmatota archaeon]|jgi:GTPase SAR1 family protein|nr:GTPase domain-containing protein [Candidatus Thermoplasmatota archaeon]